MHYYNNPDEIRKMFSEQYPKPFDGDICPGCIAVEISPPYCFHPLSTMESAKGIDGEEIQSDVLCQHCCQTVKDFNMPIEFGKETDARVKEIEAILAEIF